MVFGTEVLNSKFSGICGGVASGLKPKLGSWAYFLCSQGAWSKGARALRQAFIGCTSKTHVRDNPYKPAGQSTFYSELTFPTGLIFRALSKTMRRTSRHEGSKCDPKFLRASFLSWRPLRLYQLKFRNQEFHSWPMVVTFVRCVQLGYRCKVGLVLF